VVVAAERRSSRVAAAEELTERDRPGAVELTIHSTRNYQPTG
jgi:hypothetical protein